MPEEHGRVPETRMADFAAFVRPREGEEPPIVVGGHAVNLWSDYYLAMGVKELLEFLPFTSKDLDLAGSLGQLNRTCMKPIELAGRAH